MTDAEPIVAAARRLARSLLKSTGHCPDIEFIGIASRASCDTIASEAGFNLRIDRSPDAADMVARVYHAAAHMLCLQAGVSSHSGSRRHTVAFEQALEVLGFPGQMPVDEFVAQLNKSQKAALDSFMKALSQRTRTRPSKAKTAYERVTVKCPAEDCTHQLTIRTSAAAKTHFICAEHNDIMTASK